MDFKEEYYINYDDEKLNEDNIMNRGYDSIFISRIGYDTFGGFLEFEYDSFSFFEKTGNLPPQATYANISTLSRSGQKDLIYFFTNLKRRINEFDYLDTGLCDYTDEEIEYIFKSELAWLISLIGTGVKMPLIKVRNAVLDSENIEIYIQCINYGELREWANKATKQVLIRSLKKV